MPLSLSHFGGAWRWGTKNIEEEKQPAVVDWGSAALALPLTGWVTSPGHFPILTSASLEVKNEMVVLGLLIGNTFFIVVKFM